MLHDTAMRMSKCSASQPASPHATAARDEPSHTLARRGTIRGRSVLVGVGLTALGALAEVLASQFQVGGSPFVTGGIAIIEVALLSLLLVLAANGLLCRVRPTWAFTRGECVVIYGMVAVGGAFSAYDCMQFVVPTILYPFHYATADASLLRVQPHLPTWLAPQAAAVVEPYYTGRTSFLRPLFLGAWLGPVAVWVAFAGCLSLIMVSLSVLVRRQWVEGEHLTFPSLQVPLTLVRGVGGGPGLGGWMIGAGIAIPFALRGLQFAQRIWPAVPSIPLSTDLGMSLTASPWNALQPFPVVFRAVDLGICYFIPLDVSFSAWASFLLLKFLQVPGTMYGWRQLGWDFDGFPQWRQQAIGAWTALFFVLLWSGRRRVLGALRAAVASGGHNGVERDERWAARGLIVGFICLLAGNRWAGVDLWAAVAFIGIFLMLQLIMTRIRAQIGPPILEVFMVEPSNVLLTLVGPRSFRPTTLAIMSFSYWFTQNNRAQPMAHHLDALRLGREARVGTLPLAATLALGGCTGALVCLLSFLFLGYHYGQANFPGPALRNFAAQVGFSQFNTFLSSPRGPDLTALPGIATGGGIVMGLTTLQRCLLGFPVSPVGYVLALSGALLYNWPAFVVMWLVKGSILRYGGLRLYKRFVPLFLGMILGDIVAQFVFGLTSWAQAAAS